jgi:prepilin peptidase dependent protein B
MQRQPPLRGGRHRPARGLSIVELLIGTAVGLLVAAAMTKLYAFQLREQRALALEARLMEELGSAADLIARDLRRAGHWGDAGAAVWTPDTPPRANPYAAFAPLAAASDAAAFSYSRDENENNAVDDNERFGWRLREGAVELLLGGGHWQAATDASLIEISAFTLLPTVDEIDLSRLCTQPCEAAAAAAGTCPPRLQVRSLALRIAGHAVADARTTRAVETRIRLRNDMVTGACSA